jgi:hypothetical protein
MDFGELRELNISMNAIRNWEDLGLLYHNSGKAQYELLFPCHMDSIRRYLNDTSSRIRLQYLALETTLRGWEGYGSAVLEPFIINRMISKHISPFHDSILTYSEDELSVREKTNNDSNSHIHIASLQLDNLVHRIFGIKKDFGIDTVQFQKKLLMLVPLKQ